MKEKNKKKFKLKNFLVTGVLTFVFVSLLVSFVDGQLKLSAMQQELVDAEARTEAQESKNDALQQLLESGNENDFIERIARDKYNFVRPGERVFVDITGQ